MRGAAGDASTPRVKKFASLFMVCLAACGGVPPGESAEAAGLDASVVDEPVESQFDGGEVPLDLPEEDSGVLDAATPDDAGFDADAGGFEDAGVIVDAGAPDAGPAAPSCVEYSTRHLQASMQKTDSVADRNLAIDRAFVNPDGVSPDTIAWTEIETQAQVDRIHTRAGWATFWGHNAANPDVHPANYAPISWKTSVYEFVAGSATKSSSGKAGVTPDLYVTRVRLKHRPSGTFVVRVAIHCVAGIDTLNDNVDYRVDTHAKNITSFNEKMETAAYPPIGSGDFNTTRLPAMLKAENDGTQPYLFDVPASGGSHGNRLIDWVVHRKRDAAVYQLQAAAFVDLSPADHRGVRVRYLYRPPPCQ